MDGTLIFDRIIATPNMMPVVSKAARVLGPKGLMPSIKAGSLSEDVVTAMSRVSNATSYVFDRITNLIVIPVALVRLKETS
jgi:large subunit ribosomal protein L1